MADVEHLPRYLPVARWSALSDAYNAGIAGVECEDRPTTEGEDGHRLFRVTEPIEIRGLIFLPGAYRAA